VLQVEVGYLGRPGSVRAPVRPLPAPVNEEITRRLYDAWNRRDVEGMLADVDPDVEWRPYLASVAGKPAHGHAEVRAFLTEFSENWETFRVDIEELFDAGDHVVTFVYVRARGRGSGVEVDLKPGHHSCSETGCS